MRRLAELVCLVVLWVAVAAPTTIDRFYAVVEITQNLSTMQNNMRANVQIIQHSAETPGQPLFQDWPRVQKATQDLGTAFLQRLALNQTIMTNFPTELSAGATALGILPSDVTAVQALLVDWSSRLATATITNQTQLDAGVAAVLANVPAAMLPF